MMTSCYSALRTSFDVDKKPWIIVNLALEGA